MLSQNLLSKKISSSFYSTLKEEIKSKEEKLERNEQLLATVQTENKKLAEPLRKAKEQLVELQVHIITPYLFVFHYNSLNGTFLLILKRNVKVN